MKLQSSRRLFLKNSVLATSGLTLFSTTIVNALNNSPFDGYNPYTEELTDLRNSSFLGKHIILKGIIYDELGVNPLPNTTIEIWHLSPDTNKYNHRGKMKTNKFGEYRFKTDFPNREGGKTPRIYFKITGSNEPYFTELMINNFGAHISGKHWEENKLLENKLFPVLKKTPNQFQIDFNISI